MLPLLALLTLYATTPQRAALNVIYSDSKKPPIVLRVNVADAYATVLTSGGKMEGSPVSAAILVQHFSFGWQSLDILNFRCRLYDHALGQHVEMLLMRGMPGFSDNDDHICNGLKDAGPRHDVEAVRKLLKGPLIPTVIVSGNWAVGRWYGAGGGESLWRKRDGRWSLAQGGGGALGVFDMRRFGVPKADWCTFGIFDAKCKP
jgi:hypothetical protein